MLPNGSGIASPECSRRGVTLSIGIQRILLEIQHMLAAAMIGPRERFDSVTRRFPITLGDRALPLPLLWWPLGIAAECGVIKLAFAEANDPAPSWCRVASPGAVIGVPACTARQS
jgi:hypothetical protein